MYVCMYVQYVYMHLCIFPEHFYPPNNKVLSYSSRKYVCMYEFCHCRKVFAYLEAYPLLCLYVCLACMAQAMGQGVGIMHFINSSCRLQPLPCKVRLHFVVADLRASKDTVVILRDLNACFPIPKSDIQVVAIFILLLSTTWILSSVWGNHCTLIVCMYIHVNVHVCFLGAYC